MAGNRLPNVFVSRRKADERIFTEQIRRLAAAWADPHHGREACVRSAADAECAARRFVVSPA